MNISFHIKTYFIFFYSDSIYFHLEQSIEPPPPSKSPIQSTTISTNRRETISLVPSSTPKAINDPSTSIKPIIIKSITTTNVPSTLMYHNGRTLSSSGSLFNFNNKTMNRKCLTKMQRK